MTVEEELRDLKMIKSVCRKPITEQEPFMNKPCVANQVCREDKIKMLDKIRSEIEQMPSELTSDGRRMIRRERVFRILDNYRTESEDKE